MRNAATFDDDLGYEASPRKTAKRKPPTARAGKKKGAKRRRFDLQRVARFAAIGMAATMAIGIMVNALVLQKGHHPAPLFGKALAPIAGLAAAPLPPIRAAQVAAQAEPSTALPAKPRKVEVAGRDGDAPAADDAISRLLSGGSSTAAPKGDTKGDAKDKTVAGVQRALTKLGFKVPATGAAGPATKKAIEAFEKDRHVAVKGEVNRRLVKMLTAESGIKID